MHTNNITKSRKKYIRMEKARIRRSIIDKTEQDRLISALYPADH